MTSPSSLTLITKVSKKGLGWSSRAFSISSPPAVLSLSRSRGLSVLAIPRCRWYLSSERRSPRSSYRGHTSTGPCRQSSWIRAYALARFRLEFAFPIEWNLNLERPLVGSQDFLYLAVPTVWCILFSLIFFFLAEMHCYFCIYSSFDHCLGKLFQESIGSSGVLGFFFSPLKVHPRLPWIKFSLGMTNPCMSQIEQ